MTVRPGVTLPELILVAWLFCLVLLAVARFATVQGRLAAASHDAVRAADLVRTVDLLLNAELRHSAAPDRTAGRDSIRLRAVRGAGAVCRREGADLRVRYRGVRRPDPTKDSVLIIGDSGTPGSAHGLVAVAGDNACGPGYRLTLDPPPTGPWGLVLVFETGSYHLSDGALRYRRGRGGRQPVTEGVLGGARFDARPDAIDARLLLHPDSLTRVPGRAPTARVRLLNPGTPP